jgi:hypothetical protein
MGIGRRHKRKQAQDVKKMYDREMNKMAKMTEEQKVIHLAHLASKIKQNKEMAEAKQPIDFQGLIN